MPPLPGRRPSQGLSLGDHEGRIRALERDPAEPEEAGPGALLIHAEGRYQIATPGSVTVASGGLETIDWAYVSGDAVLDLTSPSAPTPAQSGWYTVEATFAVEDFALWTPGSSVTAKLQFHGVRLKFSWQTSTVDGNNASHEGAQACVPLSGHLRAGTDTMDLALVNNDSVSHDLTFDTIEVSMVYATT